MGRWPQVQWRLQRIRLFDPFIGQCRHSPQFRQFVLLLLVPKCSPFAMGDSPIVKSPSSCLYREAIERWRGEIPEEVKYLLSITLELSLSDFPDIFRYFRSFRIIWHGCTHSEHLATRFFNDLFNSNNCILNFVDKHFVDTSFRPILSR